VCILRGAEQPGNLSSPEDGGLGGIEAQVSSYAQGGVSGTLQIVARGLVSA